LDFSLLTTNTILGFLLILTRLVGMLVAAPFFGETGVPVQLQVGIAITISILLFPIYGAHTHIPIQNMWELAWFAGQEFVIGMLIGFVASLVFAAVQMAGSHLSLQMGLSIATALDPMNGSDSPIIGQLYFILAIFLFMSLNMHHSLILAIAKSFDYIPLAGHMTNIGLLTERFINLGSDVFRLSVLLVMPVLGIMLVEEVALAFTAKILPQMNIFMISLPLKLLIGLILIYLTLPFTIETLTKTYDGLARHLVMLYHT
jgi:flagellar biosynthesis protein FliR